MQQQAQDYAAHGRPAFERLLDKLLTISNYEVADGRVGFQNALTPVIGNHKYERPAVRFGSSMDIYLGVPHSNLFVNGNRFIWGQLEQIQEYQGLFVGTQDDLAAFDMANQARQNNIIRGVMYQMHSPEMRYIMESIADRILANTAGPARNNMINFLIAALNPDGVLVTPAAEAVLAAVLQPAPQAPAPAAQAAAPAEVAQAEAPAASPAAAV